jgi:crotonobetainyl-CoA:carnitine CoA-transferase CaiB-like acyl-CoA transferase
MILQGVRVIDVSTAVAGPYCASTLADLGAEVIKVEKPRRGDLLRFSDQNVAGTSGYFLGVNRGKKGITVDLRTSDGQAIIRELVSTADVVIENFRKGLMNDWGLGFADLTLGRDNPLIYLSISAYGDETIGFADAIGNDLTIQGYSGLMDLTGEPEGPPQRIGSSLTDIACSLQGAIAVLAALYRNKSPTESTHEHIKISLLEAAYSTLPNYSPAVLNAGTEFRRAGTGHPQFAPYKAFKCADGSYLLLGSFHNRSWLALCDAIDRSDLPKQPEFRDNHDRVRNRERLHAAIAKEIAKRPQSEWLKLLNSRDVPCAPVLSLNASLAMFRGAVPGLVVNTHHAEGGNVLMLRPPYRFAVSPLMGGTASAPTLGQDTHEVLAELGFSADGIKSLQDEGVV